MFGEGEETGDGAAVCVDHRSGASGVGGFGQEIKTSDTPQDASFQLGAVRGAIWGDLGETLETYKIGRRAGFDLNVDAFVNRFP